MPKLRKGPRPAPLANEYLTDSRRFIVREEKA